MLLEGVPDLLDDGLPDGGHEVAVGVHRLAAGAAKDNTLVNLGSEFRQILGQIIRNYILSDKINCTVCFENYFLRVPLVYLPSCPVPYRQGKQE